MDEAHRSPLRFLAPASIVVALLALLLILSSGGGGGGGGGGASAAEKSKDLGAPVSTKHSSKKRHKGGGGGLPQNVYIVKSGDTLAGIAQKTGVPIERLQELNPGLDQFSLVRGQRIKLR